MNSLKEKQPSNNNQNPPNYVLIDGTLHLKGVTKEYLQELQRLPLKGDEIFLATYPKSGTTWLSEVTWLIQSEGRTDPKPIRHRVPWLEFLPGFLGVSTKEKLDDFITNVPQPRLFKTHLPHHLAPTSADPEVKPKYIYLMRNPKDCAVSYFHHYKLFKDHEFSEETWDVFFELFMKNNVLYGSWFDHVLGWWAHRDDPNYLVLKFEDMLKDLPYTIQQIAQFVGKTLPSEVIHQIADETSFSAMSKAKGKYYDGDEDFEIKRVAGATKFLRKGEVGDWRNFFTEDQSRIFDEVYEKQLENSGLDFDFLPPNCTQ